MGDWSDYFQRRAERHLRVPKPVKVVLGTVVIFGGILLLFFGAMFLRDAARGQLPNTLPALAMILLIVALGAGFGYVGARLLRMGKDADFLLSPRATTVASYCVAGVGVATALGGLFVLWVEFLVSGIFTILIAYWLHRSARRGNSDMSSNRTVERDARKGSARPSP